MTLKQIEWKVNSVDYRSGKTYVATTELWFLSQLFIPDHALNFLQQSQHYLHSILIGFAAGAGTYAVLGVVRPKTSRSSKIKISAAVAVVAAVLFVFLASEHNPFAGTWREKVEQSRYTSGLPPKVHTMTITEERNGLKVADESVQADGTQHHLSYGLNSDGAEHPELTGRADTITAEIRGTSLETVLRKGGTIIEVDTASLSADRKELTLTEVAYRPGEQSSDILQFERK